MCLPDHSDRCLCPTPSRVFPHEEGMVSKTVGLPSEQSAYFPQKRFFRFEVPSADAAVTVHHLEPISTRHREAMPGGMGPVSETCPRTERIALDLRREWLSSIQMRFLRIGPPSYLRHRSGCSVFLKSSRSIYSSQAQMCPTCTSSSCENQWPTMSGCTFTGR